MLDPMQPVPGSGDGEPSRFLGGKHWKSLNLTPLLPNNRAIVQSPAQSVLFSSTKP